MEADSRDTTLPAAAPAANVHQEGAGAADSIVPARRSRLRRHRFVRPAAYGQPAAITGVVVDDRTERPLAGVLIELTDTAVSAETDAEGRFRLTVDGGNLAGRFPRRLRLIAQDVEARPDAP